MNNSVRILIFGLVTILGLSGFTSCNDTDKDVEVKMNDVDVMVHDFDRKNYSKEVAPYEIVKYPTHGTVQIVPGTISRKVCFYSCSYINFDVYKVLYTPTTDYIGKDSIELLEYTYSIDKSGEWSKTSLKTIININVVKSNLTRNNNNLPIADDKNITIDYETETDFNITGSDEDNDTFIFVIESKTSNGTIVLIDETTGDVTYTPNQGYSGPDHFTFKVVDEFNASSNVADVNITVKSLCDMDSTAPGCPDYEDPCLLDSTAPGCPDDPCLIDPFSQECQDSIANSL